MRSQEQFRLLRVVSQPLDRLRVDRPDIGPDVAERTPSRVFEVALELRHAAGLRLHHKPGFMRGLHALPRPAPHPRYAHELVREIRPVGIGVREIAQAIDAAIRILVDVLATGLLIELVQVVGLEDRLFVPSRSRPSPVGEDHIVVVRKPSGHEALRERALPHDLVREGIGPEDFVTDQLHVMTDV